MKRYFSISLFVFLFAFSCIADSLVFPTGFHKGVGLSAFQNGGHKVGYSNWAWFQDNFIKINAKTIFGPAIKNNEKVGYACGFWDNAINDVKLIKELGCTAFRFSIEWSEIEPVEGQFNEEILNFYEQLIDELLKNNITPMITLYHWVHPYWFERKGGFEEDANIEYFLRYCVKVFERFGKKVPFWGTINEPTVQAACGYVLGLHSPGNCFKFSKSGTVLLNLLNAHVEVYHTLKSLPGGKEAQIGIIHQLLQAEAFDPKQASNWFVGLLRKYSGIPLSKFLNFAFAHQTVKQFLKTGEFNYSIPGWTSIKYINEDAPDSYDFIGLNFYSKPVFGPWPTTYPNQAMTDMEYPVRPETLYEAIAEIAELGKPIYITENGIADAKDINRESFIIDYLKMVHKAIEDGYDVCGYYYWTLMDNFEWNEGYDMKFGLYEVDFETQKRTLRKGAFAYRDYFKIA